MVKLRLRRMGKKKQPIYKIVAADSKSPRDGRFIEAIGIYNPITNPLTLELKENILMKWLNRGATPTNTVRSLLKKKGYLLKWRLMKKNVDEETIAQEMEKFHMLQTERQRRENEKKLRRKSIRKKKASVDTAKTESGAATEAQNQTS